jgi:hypothetical protein
MLSAMSDVDAGEAFLEIYDSDLSSTQALSALAKDRVLNTTALHARQCDGRPLAIFADGLGASRDD